jgi:hypothetical protein
MVSRVRAMRDLCVRSWLADASSRLVIIGGSSGRSWIQGDTWTATGDRTQCSASGHIDRHVRSLWKTPSEDVTAIFDRGVINRSGGRPWLWLSTLGMCCLVCAWFEKPPTHLCLLDYESISEWAILVRLHHEVASSGNRCLCCKPIVLVILGGCHLLDGLVAYGFVEARKKIVRGSGKDLWGGLCSPRGDHEEQL